MKRVLCGLLAALMLLIGSVFQKAAVSKVEQSPRYLAGQALETGFLTVRENSRFALSVDPNTSNVAITDKQSGDIWTAFPTNLDSRNLSKSASKSMRSLLNLSYYNADGNQVYIGSYSSSVLNNTFEMRKITDGVRVTFYFSGDGEQFVVPLEFLLSKDHVECRIAYEDVEENGTSKICDMELLPNFGAGYQEEDGYAFVPDGSGMIASFADAAFRTASYKETIYGGDPAQDLLLKSSGDKQAIRLPVYGIKKGNSAFLSVITEGDTAASIVAQAANGYTTCDASFVYRENDLTGIQQKDSNERVINLVSDMPLTTSPRIRLYFLSGNEAGYSGMARVYRQYLIQECGLSKEGPDFAVPALTLEVFGGVQRKKTFLGIPLSSLQTVTSVAQVTAMARQLSEAGLDDVQWMLYGFTKGGYEGQYTVDGSLDRRFGSTKQWNTFLDITGRDNSFMVYDRLRCFDHSWRTFRDGWYIKSMNALLVEHYYKKPSNGSRSNFGSWYYMNLATLTKHTQQLLDKNKWQGGIVYAHMGEELYNDFRDGAQTTRASLRDTYHQMLQSTAGAGHAQAAESGSAYLLPLVQRLYEVPLDSSHFDLETRTVPFYTMVLHGYVSMASQSLNDVTDDQRLFLKALEAGIGITYRVSGCSSYELKDTKLNFLYNSEWTDDMADMVAGRAKELLEVLQQVKGQSVREQHYEGDLSITAYENGCQVVVNYGQDATSYAGQAVDANSYIIVKNV